MENEHQLRALRKGRLELLADDIERLPEDYQMDTAEGLHAERVWKALENLLGKKPPAAEDKKAKGK